MPADLSDLLPALLPDDPVVEKAIASLAQHGIKTDIDLAFVDLERLPVLSALSHSELVRLQKVSQRHLATPGRTGAADLAELPYGYVGAPKSKLMPRQRSQTGLLQLDMLLQGGFEGGEVAQVTGSKGAGKTQLVLYAVLTHLLLHGSRRAVWIDTTRSFDASRANDILRRYLVPEFFKRGVVFKNELGQEEDATTVALEVLGRIDVSVCQDANVILDTLAAAAEDKQECQLGMMVIDSLTGVLLPNQTSVGSQKLGVSANAGIVSFMRRLKGIAQSTVPSATVLVVNEVEPIPHGSSTVFSAFPTRPRQRPALGLTFTYLTDLTLHVTRTNSVWVKGEANKGTIEIAQNRRGEKGGWVGFVSDDGIGLAELQ